MLFRSWLTRARRVLRHCRRQRFPRGSWFEHGHSRGPQDLGAALESLEARRVLSFTVWENPAGGDFFAEGNWSDGVPGRNDAAIFNLPSSRTVSFGGRDRVVDYLEVGGESSGKVTLDLDQGTLTVRSTAYFSATFYSSDYYYCTLGDCPWSCAECEE